MEQLVNTNLDNTINTLSKQIKTVTNTIQENNNSITTSIEKLLKHITNTKINEQTIDLSKNLNFNILNLAKTINENTKQSLTQLKQNQLDQEKLRSTNIKQNSFLFNPMGRLDEEITKLTAKTVGSISDTLGKVVGNFGGLKTISDLSKSQINTINLQKEKRQSIITGDSEQNTENVKQNQIVLENKDNLKTITVTETKSYDKLNEIDKTLKDIKDILDIDDAEKELLKQKQKTNKTEINDTEYRKEKKKEDKEQGDDKEGGLLNKLVSGIGGLAAGAAVAAAGYEMSKVAKLLEWGSKIPKVGGLIAKGTEVVGSGLSKLATPLTKAGEVLSKVAPKTVSVFGKAASTAGKVVTKVAPVVDVGMLGYGAYKGVTMSEEDKKKEIERLAEANSTIGGAAWESTKTFFDTVQQGKNIMLANRETYGLVGDVYSMAKGTASVDINEINYIKKAGKLYNIPQVEIDKLIRMPNGNERTALSSKVIMQYKDMYYNKLNKNNVVTSNTIEGSYDYSKPVLVPGDINIPLKPTPTLKEINAESDKELLRVLEKKFDKQEETNIKNNQKIIEVLEKIYNKEPVVTSNYINQSNFPSFNNSINR